MSNSGRKIAPRTTVVAASVTAAAEAQTAVNTARVAATVGAQSPLDPGVRRVAPGNNLGPADRARQAQSVTLMAPTISGKAFVVRLGLHSWNLPTGLRVALGRSSGGRDVAYVYGVGGRVHVLVDTSEGICELDGVPLDVLDEIRTEHFTKR